MEQRRTLDAQAPPDAAAVARPGWTDVLLRLPWVLASFGVLSVALAGLFLAGMLRYTGGHLAPPLDDTYIYFQYARNLAEGRFFTYGPGEPYSTGSTSFLYPWLLAPGLLLGLSGSREILWAFGMATALLWGAAALLYALTARWLGRGAALLTVALFALSGWMLWSIFSMMETGLYIVLTLAALLAWDRGRESGRFVAFGAAGALLVLARPEGMALALLLAALAAADRFLAGGGAGLRDRQLMALFLPLGAAAGYLGLNYTLTGTTATNGLVAKSVLYRPGADLWDILASMGEAFSQFFTEPFSAPEYVPPFMLLLAAAGAVGGVYEDVAARRIGLGTAVAAAFVVGLVSISHNVQPGLHWHRYVAAYQPLFALLAVLGLVWLARVLRTDPRPVLLAGGLYLVLFTSVTLAAFLGRYSGATSDIYYQHVQAAAWLRANVPEDETVAVNDAGALPYLSGRRAYDLVGLATNGQARAFRAGPGSVMERLERLPASERPTYFAIYDDWFGGQFRGLPMFQEVQRFHLEWRSIAGGADKVIYRVDPGSYGSGEDPAEEHGQAAGWRVVDAVDVADLEDEAEHSYRILDEEAGGRPRRTVVRQLLHASGALALDGGRETARGEAFSVRATPGLAVRLVLRTDAPQPASRDVYVDGRFAGRLEYEAPGGWMEPELTIPAGLVRSDRIRIEVRFRPEGGAGFAGSYHYWVLQPAPR